MLKGWHVVQYKKKYSSYLDKLYQTLKKVFLSKHKKYGGER